MAIYAQRKKSVDSVRSPAWRTMQKKRGEIENGRTRSEREGGENDETNLKLKRTEF